MKLNLYFFILAVALLIGLSSCNNHFSFATAEVLVSNFNDQKIHEFRGIENRNGIINGLRITENKDFEIPEFKNNKVYYYKVIIDSLEIDDKIFYNLSNDLAELPADIYIANRDYSLFVVNSFNGDFNGYLFNRSKHHIDLTEHIRIGRFHTDNNEKVEGQWYKVSGGW